MDPRTYFSECLDAFRILEKVCRHIIFLINHSVIASKTSECGIT